jgi:alpha-tubulin suppressor-like RCC1 family protein
MKGFYLVLTIVLWFNQITLAQLYKEVKGGTEFSLALSDDGTLYSWGFNGNGQLGLGLPFGVAVNSPEEVEGNKGNWLTIAAGGVHALGVSKDGALWAWGSNVVNQLGDGTTNPVAVPKVIGNLSSWKQVFAGQGHSLAIQQDSSMWIWGFNTFGQVGNGNTINQSTPVQLAPEDKWVSAACGGAHTLALNSEGNLYAWGANFNGQLGTGNTVNSSIPLKIGDKNWIAISAGFEFSCGLQSDSSLWCWGFNGNGQLGSGSTTEERLPRKIVVAGVDKWKQVSCGSIYTFAIAEDGTLWGWGGNLEGALGISDQGPNITVPTKISDDDDWVYINGATGLVSGNSILGFHSFGLKTDRQRICATGANYTGQLGTGDQSRRSVFECDVAVIIISTNEKSLQVNLQYYPNPFNDQIVMQLNDNLNNLQYQLINNTGNVVMSGILPFGVQHLNTAHLIPGFYILQVNDGKQRISYKLIKNDK